MAVRILVVDDHGVVRKGLRMYLDADPDFEIVGEARDGREALALAQELRPQVILMDLLMPVMDGITATAAIRRTVPDTEVIALTSVLEDVAVAEAVKAGAIGYLLKDAESQELVTAIKAAAAGRVYLTPAALARLMRDVGAPQESPDALTPRETDVLRLIGAGKSNKEISEALSITDQTVKSHVSHILDKLGVSSRTQAALYAIENGPRGCAGRRVTLEIRSGLSYAEQGPNSLCRLHLRLRLVVGRSHRTHERLPTDRSHGAPGSGEPWPDPTHLLLAAVLCVGVSQ